VHGQLGGADVDGGDAEYIVVPAANCLPIPATMSYEVATVATDMIGTQFSTQKRLAVSGADTVAIFGLGPMGAAGVLVAKARGARVVAIGRDAGRLALAETLGADVVLDATLPDLVGPGLRLLLCGLNPSLHAADAGIGFVSPSNRFWPAARAAGIVTSDRDPWHAVREHGVGFTDLVKRASVGAAEVKVGEYRDGFARVARLVEWLQPGAVCFVGLAGYRAAADRKAVTGWQPRDVGGRPAYVMPNPSGLNARSTVASLAAHLSEAFSAPQRS